MIVVDAIMVVAHNQWALSNCGPQTPVWSTEPVGSLGGCTLFCLHPVTPSLFSPDAGAVFGWGCSAQGQLGLGAGTPADSSPHPMRIRFPEPSSSHPQEMWGPPCPQEELDEVSRRKRKRREPDGCAGGTRIVSIACGARHSVCVTGV